jgi:SAM-dependent methyltransferase
LVQKLVGAKRVVDVGCGNGSWLAAFANCGAEHILGLDGHWLEEAVLKIPLNSFSRADLFSGLSVKENFDLAVSLEVAEHLPPARAASFIADLTNLAPVILFSAAIPLQEGTNHLNEQWPSYWALLFADHSYVPVDALRLQLWNHPNVTWWYKQNTLIYVDRARLADYPGLAEAYQIWGGEARDLVHPDKYRALAKRAFPSFARWVKMLPDTLRR